MTRFLSRIFCIAIREVILLWPRKMFLAKENNSKNYEKFSEAFQAFCEAKYEPFIVNKRQVILHCRHGYAQFWRTYKLEIRLLSVWSKHFVLINLQIRLGLKWRLRTQTITTKSAKLLTVRRNWVKRKEKLCRNLYEANCKVTRICRVLKSKFDKNVSSRKLRNLIRKFTPAY